jgi:hypothetical protein
VNSRLKEDKNRDQKTEVYCTVWTRKSWTSVVAVLMGKYMDSRYTLEVESIGFEIELT